MILVIVVSYLVIKTYLGCCWVPINQFGYKIVQYLLVLIRPMFFKVSRDLEYENDEVELKN